MHNDQKVAYSTQEDGQLEAEANEKPNAIRGEIR